MEPQSQHIIYVDESGDHGMANLDPAYPMFVLAFCVFEKRSYAHEVVPLLLDFKFRHFGHDQIVLHEADIRKGLAPFEMLFNRAVRDGFMSDLNDVVEQSDFTIIASAIKKDKISQNSKYHGHNPYNIALKCGLERVYDFLSSRDDPTARMNIVVEARGKKEDNELELEFRRVRDRGNRHQLGYPFKLVFAKKQINSCGLQLADLVARPIGRKIMSPDQDNRAFSIMEKKFFRLKDASYQGHGLVIHQ